MGFFEKLRGYDDEVAIDLQSAAAWRSRDQISSSRA